MRQFFSDRWLTILLLVATIGVFIWTLSGYNKLLNALNQPNTPIHIDIPTQLSPTPTSLPATPKGSFSLKDYSGKHTLVSNQGIPVYELNANGKWIPIIPDHISANLPDTTELVLRDEIWMLEDERGNPLFRWNPTLSRWMETKIVSMSQEETEQPIDQYTVISDEFTLDELFDKSDDELIAMAPRLEPKAYGIPTANLFPHEVLRIGGNGEIPYLLYKDQDGHVKMGWNIQNGEVEHAELSLYKDTQTGFVTRVLIITDNSIIRESRRWYSLEELHPGSLAEAIYTYTLPINFFYTHFPREFRDMIGAAYESDISRSIGQLTDYQIKVLIQKARSTFSDNLKVLDSNNKILGGIKIGNAARLRVNREGCVVIFRLAHGSYLKVIGGESSNITILADLPNLRYSNSVGGGIIRILRGITIGGNLPYISTISIRSSSRSTTDQMVFDLCGDKIITGYLNLIGGEFRQKRVVPVTDSLNTLLPKCLVVENRSN